MDALAATADTACVPRARQGGCRDVPECERMRRERDMFREQLESAIDTVNGASIIEERWRSWYHWRDAALDRIKQYRRQVRQLNALLRDERARHGR